MIGKQLLKDRAIRITQQVKIDIALTIGEEEQENVREKVAAISMRIADNNLTLFYFSCSV